MRFLKSMGPNEDISNVLRGHDDRNHKVLMKGWIFNMMRLNAMHDSHNHSC